LNGFLLTPNAPVSDLEIDHITVDLMSVMYKLELADKFIVTEVKEKMYDFDLMRDVEDVIGYRFHWAE
jgi:hypothetical protein